jgi:hypothetical protein
MTDGKAYWVKVNVDCTLSYQGRICPAGGGSPPTYSYGTGWQMVGFKSTIAKAVAAYLGGTCGTTYVAPIYCWNATTQAWCSPSPDCVASMNAGSGYWVFFNSAHTMTPGCD